MAGLIIEASIVDELLSAGTHDIVVCVVHESDGVDGAKLLDTVVGVAKEADCVEGARVLDIIAANNLGTITTLGGG